MALNITQNSPNSLDFGNVAIGASSTLTIVFTNSSSPTASQDITLGGLAAPFTFGSGDDAFTLAADAATHTVDITFTPTAVGTASDTITGTTTADSFSPDNPLAIAITGVGYSTAYALPDIENNPAGVMKITLIVDPSLPELTVPDTVKVMHIGELVELIDAEPGIVDVQNMELELAEDYSTYTEGFWYKVIQGYPTKEVQFKFILEEDGVDTFWFWGKVYRQEVEWPEHYVATDESAVIRTVKIRLVSLIGSLKDVLIADALTEMRRHAVMGAYQITDVLASMVKVLFAQPFDTGDVQVRSCDMRLVKQDASTVVEIVDAWFFGATTYGRRGYIDGTGTVAQNPDAWEYRYSNAYDLVRDICLSFGWFARYYYGQDDGSYAGDGSDTHHLEMLTRGNSYATKVTAEKGIKVSSLWSDTVTKPKNIRVGDVHILNDTYNDGGLTTHDQTTGQSWSIDGATYECPTPLLSSFSADYPVVDAPLHITFDLDIATLFTIGPWLSGIIVGESYHRMLWYEITPPPTLAVDIAPYVEYYNWTTAAWVRLSSYPAALMQYYNNRFTTGRRMYERSYGSLKFTESGSTSHANLKPMKRIDIDDTTGATTFYATEIRKDFETNTSTVLWIEE